LLGLTAFFFSGCAADFNSSTLDACAVTVNTCTDEFCACAVKFNSSTLSPVITFPPLFFFSRASASFNEIDIKPATSATEILSVAYQSHS
jgi:hypothetical protein